MNSIFHLLQYSPRPKSLQNIILRNFNNESSMQNISCQSTAWYDAHYNSIAVTAKHPFITINQKANDSSHKALIFL